MAGHHSNRSHDTRAMIVKTAKELFMELGFRAVSTRQIADACGLTQPALYHHFPDKQSLYVEAIRYVCESTRSALERIIRRETGIREQLFHVTSFMIANQPEDLSRMFHDIRHEMTPEAQITIGALWKSAYLAPIISIFENGQSSGQLRHSGQFGISPEMSAKLLLGLISQSLSSQGGGGPPKGRIPRSENKTEWERQAGMLVNVLLYGLSAAEPPSV